MMKTAENITTQEKSVPIVSVITICFNAEDDLKATLNSTFSQKYAYFESIVVDGCSSDGTISYLRQLTRPNFHWISEPDFGIWDAMNKGVLLAKGRYVIFMNAGDVFADDDVLIDICPHFQNDHKYLYGDTIHKTTDSRYIHTKAGRLVDLWKSMVFSHQSFFVPRQDLLLEPFGVEDRVADYRWIVAAYIKRPKIFLYIPRVISIYALGGYSDTHYIKGALARVPVACQLKPVFYVVIWYAYFIAFEFSKRTAKKISPDAVIKFYRYIRQNDAKDLR